jgi:hypothetical protein
MHRDQADTVELGVADRDEAVLEIDVVSLQADRLAEAHARRCEQAEERRVGGGPKPGTQRAGLIHEPADAGPGPDIRSGAEPFCREDARGRHLGRRVDRAQVGGEAPGDGEPPGQVLGAGAPGQPRPGDGEFCGDRRRAGGLEEANELREQLARSLRLVSKRPAHREVAGEVSPERAHARTLPGHGAARGRSRPRSTRA